MDVAWNRKSFRRKHVIETKMQMNPGENMEENLIQSIFFLWKIFSSRRKPSTFPSMFLQWIFPNSIQPWNWICSDRFNYWMTNGIIQIRYRPFDRCCSNRLACEQIGIRTLSMACQWCNVCLIKGARDKLVQIVSF